MNIFKNPSETLIGFLEAICKPDFDGYVSSKWVSSTFPPEEVKALKKGQSLFYREGSSQEWSRACRLDYTPKGGYTVSSWDYYYPSPALSK